MMSAMHDEIVITTGARLHFGFFAHRPLVVGTAIQPSAASIGGLLEHANYGGIGLMIDSPAFVVAASKSDRDRVFCPDTPARHGHGWAVASVERLVAAISTRLSLRPSASAVLDRNPSDDTIPLRARLRHAVGNGRRARRWRSCRATNRPTSPRSPAAWRAASARRLAFTALHAADSSLTGEKDRRTKSAGWSHGPTFRTAGDSSSSCRPTRPGQVSRARKRSTRWSNCRQCRELSPSGCAAWCCWKCFRPSKRPTANGLERPSINSADRSAIIFARCRGANTPIRGWPISSIGFAPRESAALHKHPGARRLPSAVATHRAPNH